MGDEVGTVTRWQRMMVQVRRFSPYMTLIGIGVYLTGLGNSFTCSTIGLVMAVGFGAVWWQGRRTS